jgi:Tfp pilus assembly protein PilN
MIRINLIRERKAVAAKAQKKKSQASSGVQENIVLIVFALLAVGLLFGRNMMIKSQLDAKVREKNQRQAEYDKLKPWADKKLDYEVRKELLNEKIKKIGELKDRREGPVKVLEDIYNNLPNNVYLVKIEQGVDKRLLTKVDNNSKVYAVSGQSLGQPNILRLTGRTKTIDAASVLASRLQQITTRYSKVDLNTFEAAKSQAGEKEAAPDEFEFVILFVSKLEEAAVLADDKQQATQKKAAK